MSVSHVQELKEDSLTKGMKTASASMTPIRGKPSNTERALQGMDIGEEAGPSVNQSTCRKSAGVTAGLVHHLFLYHCAGHVAESVAFDFGSSRK